MILLLHCLPMACTEELGDRQLTNFLKQIWTAWWVNWTKRPVYTCNFCCDLRCGFLLLKDVKEWANNECSEYVSLPEHSCLVFRVVMCGKYSFTKFANFLIIVLRAEIATTFGSKMVTISARDIMREFGNFVRLYFYTLQLTYFNQILKFYYFWKVLSGNFVFIV